jgi:hypothetical protein
MWTVHQNTNIWNAQHLASDENFIQLNEVLTRFDPVYLQIVFRDTNSYLQLSQLELEHLKLLLQQPDDTILQNKLVADYHFESKEQLLFNVKKLNTAVNALSIYFKNEQIGFDNVQLNLFLAAKKQFAKNKMDEIASNDNRKKVVGIGQDFASEYASEFDYYNIVYNENMEEELNGGMICSNPCCVAWMDCKARAQSRYTSNSYSFLFGGIVLLGSSGFVTGSIYPIIGNTTGFIFGAIYGGLLGILKAKELYIQEDGSCNLNYHNCILSN